MPCSPPGRPPTSAPTAPPPPGSPISTDTTGKYPDTYRGGGGFGLRYAINEYADLDFYYNYERRNNRVSGFSNHQATVGVTFYLSALRPRRETGVAAAGEGGVGAPLPIPAR